MRIGSRQGSTGLEWRCEAFWSHGTVVCVCVCMLVRMHAVALLPNHIIHTHTIAWSCMSPHEPSSGSTSGLPTCREDPLCYVHGLNNPCRLNDPSIQRRACCVLSFWYPQPATMELYAPV